MRKLSLFLILFLAFSVRQACAQAPALIEGTVINKLTGAPIKGAHVIYNKTDAELGGASSPISTDTDAQGHFSVQMAAGTYRLWVERGGFARQVYGALSAAGEGTALTLAAGQQLRQLVFRITPLGAMAGHVFDEDGEPLQGVGIQVLRSSYSSGHRQLVSVAGVSSNDRGEYRVFGLPAGRYMLLATPPGAPISRPIESGALVAEAQDMYAALYYPGVPEVDAASPVAMPEGGELDDLDFRLRKVRAVTLRGRVLSPVRASDGQLQVVLAHNERNSASYIDRASAAVDFATGRFEIHGVSPGSYLLVGSQLAGGRVLGGRIPVEISSTAPPEAVTLPLTPSSGVQGAVEVEGAPRASLQNVIVRLTPAEGLALGPQPASKVGTDGSIRLMGVTPGLWTLSFDSLPDGLWIKTATFAGNEIAGDELRISDGMRGPLRIVLAGNGAQISGTVTANGQPCRATVVLAPAAQELRGSPQLFRITHASDRGVFNLKSVRPGTYKLFAFQEIAPFAWLDPEELKLVEDLGQAFTVGEGESAQLDLTAILPDALLPSR